MIDKMYRFIDGFIIVFFLLAVARIVTGIAVWVMPSDALDTENAAAVGREIARVYQQGSIGLMDYLVNSAFYEEILFRFVPIMLFAKWSHNNNNYTCNPYAVRTIIIVGAASVIFGYLHGGFWNIFVQGFYGVVFSTVFIFTANRLPSSLGRAAKSVVALGASTLVHAFSNYAIILSAQY